MQPPAEHVHWLFATGFLLLGALPARAGDRRRRGLGRRRAGAPTSGRACSSALGVLMWPVMVFFTNSTIHMLAHGAWAQTMMLAGAAELGLVRGKLHNRAWRLAMPLALVVSGAAFLVHEQNGWFFARSAFLHHVLGWTALDRRALPARSPSFRPRSRVWRRRLRADARRRLGAALLRPRRRAGLRPPLAARRGAAPMRRLLAVALARARAARRRPRRTRRWCRRRPRSGSGSSARRSSCGCTSTRASRRCRTRSTSTTRRAGSSRARRARAPDNADDRRARSRLPRGAYTVRWRAISADGHVVSGVFTFGVRVPAPPRDRGVRRRRARRRPSTSSAGSTSSRSRCSSAGSASGCSSCAGRCGPRRERRFYRLRGRRRGRRARGRDRRLPAARRGRAAAAVRASSSTATCRRSRRDALRRRVRRDDARLRARRRARLPRLADRPRRVLLWPAFALALGFASGPLALGPLGRRRRLVVAVGARRLGAPLGGVALGRRARAARVRGLAARAGAAAAGVPALLAARDGADRRAARGRDLPEHPAAAAPRTTSGRAATGRCCS